VNYANIAENARRVAGFSGKKIFAAVKNDAYNLGLLEVVDTLLGCGVGHFAVALFEDAAVIKKRFPSAYVLQFNPADEHEIEAARKIGVALSITGERWFNERADSLRGIELHLKINVGMNRFGVSSLDAARRTVRRCGESGLSLTGLFTHFPLAEEKDLSEHLRHVGDFVRFYETLSDLVEFKYVHSENTAAVLLHDERLAFCNFVRPGAMLCGYSSRERVNWLLPSVYVSSAVVDLVDVPKGERLGYGTDFTAEAPLRVAVLPIGYGDGIMRVRKAAPVFIKGVPYRIVSKIFMSHTFVEVDERVGIGDEAELYGDRVRIDDLSSIGVATNSEQMASLKFKRS
jgi:alanine racemase